MRYHYFDLNPRHTPGPLAYILGCGAVCLFLYILAFIGLSL